MLSLMVAATLGPAPVVSRDGDQSRDQQRPEPECGPGGWPESLGRSVASCCWLAATRSRSQQQWVWVSLSLSPVPGSRERGLPSRCSLSEAWQLLPSHSKLEGEAAFNHRNFNGFSDPNILTFLHWVIGPSAHQLHCVLHNSQNVCFY